MDEELKTQVDLRIKRLVPEILKSSAFTYRKLTDTPTDSLAVVNRKYVTNNGSIASRPTSSVAVIGQIYLATDLATPTPMWYTQAGWRNGVGSICALNN